MYCEAAEYIISEKPDFMERMLQIPAEVCERICESWNRDELSLYGRFDFLLDEKGVPRILELMQIRLHPCSKRQSFSGSGKKNVFLNVTNITVFMKVWFNRGKIYSLREAIYTLSELLMIMKILEHYNIWQVQLWKLDILHVCLTLIA